MTDLICVDFAAQEDLMLQDQLARALAARQAAGLRQMVIQGSSETLERRLETRGFPVVRTDGALGGGSPDQMSELVETVSREANRLLANRITDEGLYASALMGADRGFLRWDRDGLRCSAKLEGSAWPADGVIPVLASTARDEADRVVDVHPVRTACAVSAALGSGSGRIILLASRKTPAYREAIDGKIGWDREKVGQSGAISADTPMPPGGMNWLLSHVSDLASGAWVEVS